MVLQKIGGVRNDINRKQANRILMVFLPFLLR